MAISDLIGLQGIGDTSPTLKLPEILFGRNVVLLNDVTTILGLPVSVPVPLVGFHYKPLSQIELLKYQYSKFPYLNRQTLTNGYVRETVRFSVECYSVISKERTFIINYGLNEALYKVLEQYTQQGGTFTILTPYATLSNCVLIAFSGISTGARDVGGQGFKFDFEQINIAQKGIGGPSDWLNSIAQGVAL